MTVANDIIISTYDFFLQFSRCNTCDSLFNTLMSLEHHKELYEHWSDDDYITDEDDDFDDDYEYELDEEYIRKIRRRAREEEAEFLQFQNRESSILLL